MAIGLGVAALLLVVMALTRWWVSEVRVPDLELREIELAAPEEPPPPPPESEPPPELPPPPALSEVSEVPDPTRVPVPKAEVPMDLEMPVDTFFTDLEPAPLPRPAVVRRTPAPAPRRTAPARPAPPPPPKAKSHYSMNELDSRPRLLRHGSAAFPSSLARRGVSSGTVTFEVELSSSGAVSVRRVISTTHSELVSAARRVASGARFTRPTRNGQPVKAIMRWPITIRK